MTKEVYEKALQNDRLRSVGACLPGRLETLIDGRFPTWCQRRVCQLQTRRMVIPSSPLVNPSSPPNPRASRVATKRLVELGQVSHACSALAFPPLIRMSPEVAFPLALPLNDRPGTPTLEGPTRAPAPKYCTYKGHGIDILPFASQLTCRQDSMRQSLTRPQGVCTRDERALRADCGS